METAVPSNVLSVSPRKDIGDEMNKEGNVNSVHRSRAMEVIEPMLKNG